MARTLQGGDIAERQLSDIAQRRAGGWAERWQGHEDGQHPRFRVYPAQAVAAAQTFELFS